MEIERVKVLAKSVDYGIHQEATEHTKLLSQSFDYGSRHWLTKNANSKECIVQMPKHSAESISRKSTPLTLEELMHYRDDPWWKFVRRTLLISFWLALFAIFSASCIIVFLEDKKHCAVNSTKSTTQMISESDGVFHRNLSSTPLHFIESTTKKFFNKPTLQ